MNDDQFQSSLRERADRLAVRVPVDLGAVIAEGRAARARHRRLIVLGLLGLVLALVAATLFGLHVARQVVPPPPTTPTTDPEITGTANPYTTPTKTPTETPTEPSVGPLLTDDQFDNLISVQLPAIGFPSSAVNWDLPYANITRQCAGHTPTYEGAISGIGYENALEADYDSAITAVVHYATSREAPLRLPEMVKTCAQQGAWADVQLTTDQVGDVVVSWLTLVAEEGEVDRIAFAVIHNVLVVSDNPTDEAWTDFVTHDLPQAVAAALDTPAHTTPVLPEYDSLTVSQFEDLVERQLTTRVFPDPQGSPPGSLRERYPDCTVAADYEGTRLAGDTYEGAMDGHVGNALTTVELYASEDDAITAVEVEMTCLDQLDDLDVTVTSGSADGTGIITRNVSLCPLFSASCTWLNFAQIGNVVLVADSPNDEDWIPFLSDILPESYDAALNGIAPPAPPTLTQDQFDHLVTDLLPTAGLPVEQTYDPEEHQAAARIFSAGPFPGRPCPGYDNLEPGTDMVSQAFFDLADPRIRVMVSRFDSPQDAARVAELAGACVAELGGTVEHEWSTRIGQATSNGVLFTDRDGADNRLVFVRQGNVMAYTYGAADMDWDGFVRDTFLKAVDAAVG